MGHISQQNLFKEDYYIIALKCKSSIVKELAGAKF